MPYKFLVACGPLSSTDGLNSQLPTRPHTIEFGLNDGPLAILMSVGEKYIEAAGPENQKKRYWDQPRHS